MKYIQLFEAFSGTPNQAIDAYNALMGLVSFYDGYAEEIGVEKDDRYWGDMVAINDEMDKIMGAGSANNSVKIKTVDDITKNWDAITSIAAKIIKGAEGYISEKGEANRYLKNAGAKISKAKKLFNLK